MWNAYIDRVYTITSAVSVAHDLIILVYTSKVKGCLAVVRHGRSGDREVPIQTLL